MRAEVKARGDTGADTDGVRTSQQCVCIYTAVYSQTLTAISIFKYVNIICIIQVHTAHKFAVFPPPSEGKARDPPGTERTQREHVSIVSTF